MGIVCKILHAFEIQNLKIIIVIDECIIFSYRDLFTHSFFSLQL